MPDRSTDPGSDAGTGTTEQVVRRVRRRRIVAEPLGYVAPLDGLRAVAVLVVVFYHARFEWVPGGYLGVSAFFTLSGFLITSLLLREWTSTDEVALRPFWQRRFRRLLPASWTTMGLVLVFAALGIWNDDQLRSLRGDVPFGLLEIINWHFISQDRSYGAGFEAPSPLEHFWSLAVEQQFYIVLPLIVIGVLVAASRVAPRRRLATLTWVFGLLTVVSAGLNWYFARESIDRAYFGTDTRMAEMLIGGLLACATLRRLRLPTGSRARLVAVALGVLALGVSAWMWHVATLESTWMYPWGFLLCALCTSAVIFAALQGGMFATVFSVAPLLWLGRISYGIYLLHWPIFLWLSPARIRWAQWPLFGLRMAVTIAAAAVMFRLIENPIRHRQLLLAPRAAPITAAVMAVALLAGTFVVTRDVAPRSELATASAESTTTTIPPPPVKVLIAGDETAGALGAAVQGIDGLEVSVSAVPHCGLTVGGFVTLSEGTVERDVARCGNAMQTWLDAIQTNQPDVVLVSAPTRDVSDRRLGVDSTWQDPAGAEVNEFLRSDLTRAVDDLTASGAEVVLLTSPSIANGGPTAPFQAAPDPMSEKEAALMAVEADAIAQGSPGPGFRTNDPARLQLYNALLGEVAADRGVGVLDLATHTAALPVEPGAPGVFIDGRMALPPESATQLGTWLLESLRDRAPQAAAVARPPVVAADAPLPPAPAPRERRVASPGGRVTALVVGDSATFSLATYTAKWGSNNGELEVVNSTQFGCAISRGGEYRFQRDRRVFEDRCDFGTYAPELVAGHRPEVAVVGSGIWEVVDRRLVGDDRYRNITDPSISRYVLIEFLSLIDTLGADGATVVLLQQPHIQSGLDQGFQGLPESDPARIDQLNALMAEAVALRPGVARMVDLQGWLASQPGGELDPAMRPDGIHFSNDASALVADWLGPQLVAIGRGQG